MTDKNNTANLATNIADLQGKMAREKIKKETDVIFNALVESAPENTSTMPENVFKDYFYPFFSGQKKIDENPNVMAEWIAIAKSPHARVTIVDQNGSPQFQVPPIMDSSIIETVKRNLGETFSDIYTQYSLHSRNLPILGERYLAQAFSEKIPKIIKPSEAASQNAAMWNAIFDRYKDTGSQPQSTSTTENKNGTSSDEMQNDLLGYE